MLSVYMIPTLLPEPLKPYPYTYVGCNSEPATGRALTGGSVANNAMSVTLCSWTCHGFSMFGLE